MATDLCSDPIVLRKEAQGIIKGFLIPEHMCVIANIQMVCADER